MVRPLRIEFMNAFYHVFSRGNEKKSIFVSDADREKFLGYLRQAHQRFKIKIHAFCLMGNHYHLVVETPLANLSRTMQFIGTAYTVYFNKRLNRSGHLFQGRYRAIIVEKDQYLKELVRYIHLNPVKKGLAKNPAKYLWASYKYYIGEEDCPEFLEMDMVYSYFSKKKSVAIKRLIKFTEENQVDEIENLALKVKYSAILGTEEYSREIKEKYLSDNSSDEDEVSGLKKLKNSAVSKDRIVQVVRQIKGLSEQDRRKRIIWLLRAHTDMKLKEVAEFFPDVKPSAISQMCIRFQKEQRTNNELDNEMRSIKEMWNV